MTPDTGPKGHLLHNLVLFARALRGAGLPLDPGGLLTLVRALEYVDVGRRQDFYMAARCALVHRQQDLAAFDEVFRVFWRQPKNRLSTMDLRSLGEQRRYRTPQVRPSVNDKAPAPSEDKDEPGDRILLPSVYSAREVLRVKDFSAYTAEEVVEAKRMLASLAWDVGRRRTRRWVPGEGRLLHIVRTLRVGTRFGGEYFRLVWRARKEKPRSLVLLCDISGSMEQYTRMLLHFMHAFLHSREGRGMRVRAFAFATRLTRIDRQLAHRGVDRAVEEVARAVPDWAGGTRIGEAIKNFNYHWARRVLRSESVVLIISDGWDRGEPEVLRSEVVRLQRGCHRLVWLNPLLGRQGYQPLTQGMQAALPHVDDFLPINNLASLQQLGEHLNQLPARRALRPQRREPTADHGGRLPPAGEAPSEPRGQLDAHPTFRHPLWGGNRKPPDI